MSATSDVVGHPGNRDETAAHAAWHDPERVDRVRADLPGPVVVGELAATFGLLADASRLKLLIALSDGEMCVCDLAAACGQTESGVSHALRLLRAHRVVAVRRTGRRAFYRLADDHVQNLLDLALTHQSHTTPLGAVPTDGAA